jgi:hypothetical protein
MRKVYTHLTFFKVHDLENMINTGNPHFFVLSEPFTGDSQFFHKTIDSPPQISKNSIICYNQITNFPIHHIRDLSSCYCRQIKHASLPPLNALPPKTVWLQHHHYAWQPSRSHTLNRICIRTWKIWIRDN